MGETMQFGVTVRGTSYADLQFKTNQAVASFMAGAPEGSTAVVIDIGQAVKVDDVPSGWDSALNKITTAPLFELTSRWNVVAA